ncbi:MAG TPA: hypothetical protein VLL52_17855, partial [Anaerolineae bacterium]|nr:hypothetical protein [Anaerolineae bacterium]
ILLDFSTPFALFLIWNVLAMKNGQTPVEKDVSSERLNGVRRVCDCPGRRLENLAGRLPGVIVRDYEYNKTI